MEPAHALGSVLADLLQTHGLKRQSTTPSPRSGNVAVRVDLR
jgi:hypothetical protein